MILKRIGIGSCAKLCGVLYALMGLILGALFSLFALIGGAAGMASGQEGSGFAMLFGMGAIIFLPIFYGILGVIIGAIGAAIYNLAARWVGGLELEFEGAAGTRASAMSDTVSLDSSGT